MIRNLLVSIFFFIGPALLMFILRNIVMIILLTLKNRQRRAREQEVIDVTPIHHHIHPNWFVIVVVIVSTFIAVTVFMKLQNSDDVEPHQYVPAHMGESGKIVPGGWKPKEPASDQQ
ncbi:hypothetical protein MMIC_P2169 [Mariprofundus micogutta]|uniref:Uncharacterized protein n=1 Tax=Mariprofundus micogutta TaxID=1921010 RepID=A0A1L8CQU6_9PROT|nr:hypothetical protein [Mariprofundus micogutta]GAV21189.1 hypothetical protein MMIC_P2169 [Mariprofundus micogutta]